MLIKSPNCNTNCQIHRFSLHHHTLNKYNIQASFCPKFHREPRPPTNTFPQFNRDSKYYTPAFVSQVDKIVLERGQKEEFKDFKRRIRDAGQKKGRPAFPQPYKKTCYCSVCRTKYKHYFKHIMSQQHAQKIRSTIANDFIEELTQKFVKIKMHQKINPIKVIDLEEMDIQNAEKIIKKTKKINKKKRDFSHYIISSQNSGSQGSQSNSSSYNKNSSQSSQKSFIESISSVENGSPSMTQGKKIAKKINQINLDSQQSCSVQFISTKNSKKNKKMQKNIKEKNINKVFRKIDDSSDVIIEQNAKKISKKGRQKSALPVKDKTQEILIQKAHVFDPAPQASIQNILQNIVHSIKPPTKNYQKQEMNKNQNIKTLLSTNINSPFFPVNIKKNIQERINFVQKTAMQVQPQKANSVISNNQQLPLNVANNPQVTVNPNIQIINNLFQNFKQLVKQPTQLLNTNKKIDIVSSPAPIIQQPTRTSDKLVQQNNLIKKGSQVSFLQKQSWSKKIKQSQQLQKNKKAVIEITDNRNNHDQKYSSNSRYLLSTYNPYQHLNKLPHHKKFFPRNTQKYHPTNPINIGKKIIDFNCKPINLNHKKQSIDIDGNVDDDDQIKQVAKDQKKKLSQLQLIKQYELSKLSKEKSNVSTQIISNCNNNSCNISTNKSNSEKPIQLRPQQVVMASDQKYGQDKGKEDIFYSALSSFNKTSNVSMMQIPKLSISLQSTNDRQMQEEIQQMKMLGKTVIDV